MKTLLPMKNKKKDRVLYAIKHTDKDGQVSYLANGDKSCWSKYYAKRIGQTFVNNFGGKFELEEAQDHEH